jgi:hypothetical protein
VLALPIFNHLPDVFVIGIDREHGATAILPGIAKQKLKSVLTSGSAFQHVVADVDYV